MLIDGSADHRVARHVDELTHHLRIHGNRGEQRSDGYNPGCIGCLAGPSGQVVGPGETADIERGSYPAAEVGAMKALGMLAERGDDGIVRILGPKVGGVGPPIDPAGLGVVDVRVDQSRTEKHSAQINRLGAGRPWARARSSSAGDAIVLNEYGAVRDGIDTGVDQSGVLQA